MVNATYSINNAQNGIEVMFSAKPTADVLENLKANGFRWHRAKKLWYCKRNNEREEIAKAICSGNITETVSETPKSKEETNKYGVKVGDLFVSSWGYEQTNVDFFQVVKLCGKSSVRVRHVIPRMVNEEGISGMSADRTYEVTREMLKPVERSIFINDQENGDLKRLKSYDADGVSNPQFNVHSFASASLCTGETVKCYESWYY